MVKRINRNILAKSLKISILDLYIDPRGFGDKMALKCSPLSIPCKLSMSDHDIHLMQAFRGQLQRVGITFEDASSSGAQSSVRIKTVPSVFLARELTDDGEVLRNEIKNCIEVYTQELTRKVSETRNKYYLRNLLYHM